jgi:CSLREA domain-containing protein
LRTAIDEASAAGILFVAAAGNGNILGQGVDLDREPFYPASYDLANVISVAATGPNDELARFSNYGATTVDLAAPGIGVLSTLPGARYGTANGTSMAAPHVAGVAALVWSEEPDATVAEVRQAILSGGDELAELQGLTVTGGRLNALQALNSDAFAPRAKLIYAENITVAGGGDNLLTVHYSNRKGIDVTSLGDGNLMVTRHWGPTDPLPVTLVSGSLSANADATEVTATYRLAAPGGDWDVLDFGRYAISVVGGHVRGQNGLFAHAGSIGEFSVRIADPSVFYVDTLTDAADANVGDGIAADIDGRCTLRAAIQEANAAAPASRTIILEDGTYTLSLPGITDPNSAFPTPPPLSGVVPDRFVPAWSDARSGDLDLLGNVTILGADAATTTIDAAGIDRVFKVYPGANVTMARLRVTGGRSVGAGGGGILTMGTLHLDTVVVADNAIVEDFGRGGGVAVWGGETSLQDSTVWGNSANGGGGIFVGNQATLDVSRSTIARNRTENWGDALDWGGGGILSFLGGDVQLTNSTVSENESVGGDGAAIRVISGEDFPYGWLYFSMFPTLTLARHMQYGDLSTSADGRFVAFDTEASHLVPGDTNGTSDVFLYDRQNGRVEWVSVASNGTQGNGSSGSPSVSADGRFVAFDSNASNLVPGDTNGTRDVFVYDRQNGAVERVSVANDGTQGNDQSLWASVSADDRFVAFTTDASNLVTGDTNGATDVLVYDRHSATVARISIASDGTQGDGGSWDASLSADGRFVAFVSDASNFVPGDTNGTWDVFVYDRQRGTVERVSVASDGTQGDWSSYGPSLSADGRFVAFTSGAFNLVPKDTNEVEDVFVYDRQNGTLERVSVASDGTEGNNYSRNASLSADGRFVTFESDASNLVPGDTNPMSDMFVFDRQEGTISLVIPATSPVVLESTTVADNHVAGNAAAVSGHADIHNSLFTRNLSSSGLPSDWASWVRSLGYNIISISATTNVFMSKSDRVDPSSITWLGALADNGGPTWTHALLSGSTAIDAADPGAFPPTDQRGVARPQDGVGRGAGADVGAFEAYHAVIQGVEFQDLNQDGRRDVNERGLAGVSLYLDMNKNGRYDVGEPLTSTRDDDPTTVTVNEQGFFAFYDVPPGTNWVSPLLDAEWRATVDTSMERMTDGVVSGPYGLTTALSVDGRFVAFSTAASNLVPGDTNGTDDVFVYDRQSDTVERVSVASDGTQGKGSSYRPSLTADGRIAAFWSYASNLVPGDTNGAPDVFGYDRQSGTVERVSVASHGTEGDSHSYGSSLSADGRFVAFSNEVSNLVLDDLNGCDDVFVYDRQSDRVERVSVASDGTEGDNQSGSPSMSADGRFVAFQSDASNLVPGDTNGRTDVFVYDRQSGTVERVSVASDGTQGDGGSGSPSLSPDGRFVAFQSDASNLVPGDTNGRSDLFVYDRQNGTVERVSVASDGTQGDSSSSDPSLSADGRFVAFQSDASNLVPDDTNGGTDVFVYDRQSGTVERVSVASDGTQGNSSSNAPSISADGRFVAFSSDASNLITHSDTNGCTDVFVYDRQTQMVKRVSVAKDGTQGNSSSNAPSISADGRFVAFDTASNLVPGDTNEGDDTFVYDQQDRTVERVSVASNGRQGDYGKSGGSWPSLSADGRFVAFGSSASHLVPGDTNGVSDVFVRDRQNGAFERVSVASDGTQGDSSSGGPSLSADGRFVAFWSYASNLVPGDTNGVIDVFVCDRQSGTIERVSVANDGTQGNSSSESPSLSPDGRFVAFSSFASNLVPGDTGSDWDVFVYDRQNHTIESLSAAHGTAPSFSADNRFVAFDSSASNLVPEDTNGARDVFVRDRQSGTIERISVASDGTQGNGGSYNPFLSADGRFVAFASYASNLVPGDTNGAADLFVKHTGKPDDFPAGTASLDLLAGQVLSGVEVGVVPLPGEIRGRCFQDVIANGVYDRGEPGQQGWMIFLDDNANGRLDNGELSTHTDAEGNYAFTGLSAAEEYRVALVLQNGYTTVLPTAENHGVWKVFLPAGGELADRDFGVRPVQTAGQSESAVIQGRVFMDRDGNGRQDPGEPGIAGATLFLDLNNDGTRQYNEPQELSASDDPNTPDADETGEYLFEHLGNRPYTVRVVEVPHQRQTAPVGNSFTRRVYSLAVPGNPLGSPQDVAIGDYNDDGHPDLATAIYDRNAVSVLLNDGHGSFPSSPIEIPLEPQGYGPVALLAGDFNDRGGQDLAVVNSLSSKIAILLDFDGMRFASTRYVPVGVLPSAVAGTDLNGDGSVDLIVTNEADNNLSVLWNDGQGIFTSDAAGLPVGHDPLDVVVGDFNGDQQMDLAVADFGTNPKGSDLGDVRVLLRDVNGSFLPAQTACQVGFGPAALVAADLNGDHHLDLAVANFLSDDVTVCQGAGDGTFRAVATLTGGQGPMDLEAADLENDGDLDLLLTNGKSKTVGILRNRLAQGTFGFEPAESFGTADFLGAWRISVAAGDLDHSRTPDLVVVNSQQNSVTVNLNAIVGGAQRMALTGVETVQAVDFGFQPVNAPPTLDLIADPSAVNEDSPELTVSLSGISAGVGDTQPLRVTASSDNPELIATVSVDYNSPATTGSLRFAPSPNQSGRAVITVMVTDGGLDNSLATEEDNGMVSRSFTLTVRPLNDPPTLDALPAFVAVDVKSPGRIIALSGISAGLGESQPIRVTADTNNPQWIQNLSISYPGTGTTGTLSFTTNGTSGSGRITVTVTDGGLDNDLATVGDNLSSSQMMAVLSGSNINPLPTVTINQAGDQRDPTNVVPVHFTVVFSEAVSDFAAEDVTLGGTAPGTLVAVVSGSGTTYDVAVSGMTDTGTVVASLVAGVAHTAADNPNQTSTSTDNQITFNPWHHAVNPCDVDGNSRVEALDVLTLINYVNAHPEQLHLPAPPPGVHPLYDVDNSGGCSALDVLLVINYINSHPQGGTAEGEGATSAEEITSWPRRPSRYPLPKGAGTGEAVAASAFLIRRSGSGATHMVSGWSEAAPAAGGLRSGVRPCQSNASRREALGEIGVRLSAPAIRAVADRGSRARRVFTPAESLSLAVALDSVLADLAWDVDRAWQGKGR